MIRNFYKAARNVIALLSLWVWSLLFKVDDLLEYALGLIEEIVEDHIDRLDAQEITDEQKAYITKNVIMAVADGANPISKATELKGYLYGEITQSFLLKLRLIFPFVSLMTAHETSKFMQIYEHTLGYFNDALQTRCHGIIIELIQERVEAEVEFQRQCEDAGVLRNTTTVEA